MTIYISNPTSPIIIDRELKKNRYNMTPDYVREVLTQTNHSGNIKQILRQITHNANNHQNDATKNLIELQKIAQQYKDVLLDMVDRRNHTKSNMELIKKIADAGGYLEELKQRDANDKIYDPIENRVLYITSREDTHVDFNNYKVVICDAPNQEIFISNADNVKRYEILNATALIFVRSDLEGSKLTVNPQTNLTYLSSRIELEHLELPANSITMETSSSLYPTDTDRINFKANVVNINDANNLRKKVLDFSQTNFVRMQGFLFETEEIIFKPGADVRMVFCNNFPKKLDFSMCKEVVLSHSDLSDVTEITFKDEEQKNRFLQDTKTGNHHIKCKFTNPSIPPQIYNEYKR